MPLDPKTCPIGTVGFLPIASTYEFEGYGDESPFEYFKRPSVVLNAEREWVSIEPTEDDLFLDGTIWVDETHVYATWQEAVRATIDSDRESAEAIIREAQGDLAQAVKVEQWLKESEHHGNG